MKDRKLATNRLRETLHYVARFRNSALVIAIDGRALEDSELLSIAGDISLLHEVGIRVTLVLGSSDQSDYRTRRKNKNARILFLAEKLCQSTNTVHSQYLSPIGIEGAAVQEFTVKVTENDIGESLQGKVQGILAKGLVPTIIAAPKDGVDESWFGALLRLTATLCCTIMTDKLIYLSCFDGIFQKGQKGKKLLREAQPGEIRQLVADGVITGQFAEFAATAERVINAGVRRVHIINGKIGGGLLNEVFTKDGIGTMIHQDPYQEIRPARKSDIGGILNILGTQESHGDARRHTEKMIEVQLANYRVAVKDDEVIAYGCLRCFPGEKKALISSLDVDQPYISQGIGELMLKKLFAEAKGQDVTLLTMISPRTGQWWLSREFDTGTASDLPNDLQASVGTPSTTILVCRLED